MTFLRNLGAFASFMSLFGVLLVGYALANPESASRYHHRVVVK